VYFLDYMLNAVIVRILLMLKVGIMKQQNDLVAKHWANIHSTIH